MNNRLLIVALATLLGAAPAARSQTPGFLPGQRVLLDAHNCYPYEGQWTNRITRALTTGVPLAIEVDLIWAPASAGGGPRIVVRHGGQAKGDEPSLERYFFEQVCPLMETALREGNRRQWPLVTLNVNDLRASAPEFFAALWKLLGDHEPWLCTAPKTAVLQPLAPLEVKPLLVLTSDGVQQRRVFYEEVPVGGRLRLFAAGKPDRPADNFCRWLNYDWKAVEPEGQTKAGDWSQADAARLQALVEQAHRLGYWIRCYTLNGHTPLESLLQGWSPSYNFGSTEAAILRWRAARAAGVDFIATDQYEAFAEAAR